MPFYKKKSFRNKLIIIQLLTAFIAILLCCVLFVINDIKIFNKSLINIKQSIAEIVGSNSVGPLLYNDADAARQLLNNLKNNPSILNAAIFDKHGLKFAQYNRYGTFLFPPPGSQSIDEISFIGQRFIVQHKIIVDNEVIGTVMLRSEQSSIYEILSNYLKAAGMVLLPALAIAFVMATFFQKLITNRLLRLVNKTKEISASGNYSNRLYDNGSDELGVLAIEFNNLLDQIQRMQNSLKESNLKLEKRVKERTIELERSNQELEQFAYIASHDLQEPLRTISNFVGLLKKEYSKAKDQEQYRYFQFVQTATIRMQNLITDLLELAIVGRHVVFKKINCNKIIQEVITEIAIPIKECNAAISVKKLPELIASELELKRLFQNLISNALKFRKPDVAPQVEIVAEEHEEEYLFSITDNGIGMDEEYATKIFNIFQRLHSATEYPGTGIGLATCKKIIAFHNGKIWLKSAIGKGTTFYFTISKHLNNNANQNFTL